MVARILGESQPLVGSLAASYLAGRGLTRHTSTQLRFHPGLTMQVDNNHWTKEFFNNHQRHCDCIRTLKTIEYYSRTYLDPKQ